MYMIQSCSKLTRFLNPILFTIALSAGQMAHAASLNLKVLIVSTGNPSEDAQLDLMDDVLIQLGVPFDVLDASRDELTAERLSSPGVGNYNGIILTNAELYLPSGGSGFTPQEWALLHEYERQFGVRESVMSGFPATNPALGLDYGMKNGVFGEGIVARSSFTGIWQAPAGGTDLFEYINTSRPFAVNDFAFAFEPEQLYVGTPMQFNGRPLVQPLLTAQDDPSKTLISVVRYPDGRQVLLSTIAQATFLLHSQALSYEFLNFATKGVFIGARQVHLTAHVDDVFLANELWNPELNMTDESRTYRNRPAAVNAIVAAQNALRTSYPTMKDFVVDFAFNGSGAVPETPVPDRQLRAVADTHISSSLVATNFGGANVGVIKSGFLGLDTNNLLVRFDVPANASTALTRAQLTFRNRTTGASSLSICRVTTAWDESNGGLISLRGATWLQAAYARLWRRSGGDFDSTSCINVNNPGGASSTYDVTPIVQSWLSGTANHGLIVRMRGTGETRVSTREAGATVAPMLTLSYAPIPAEPLTAAIVANRSSIRFINHSFTHANMDSSTGMDYATASNEILNNSAMWRLLGLPEYNENIAVMVTGEHSGLSDKMGTRGDITDDLEFPDGRNQQFLQAAFDSGIRYLASDSSRLNQNIEGYVPGLNILLLPRYPTNIFYNASTPTENTDEYNYVFHERHLLAGEDPCLVPGAICEPKTYAQILEAEADNTVRHMLTFRPWPHYFHQSNLRRYNSGSATPTNDSLLSDWLKVVAARYEQIFNLPVKSLPYHQIGLETRQRVRARNANVTGIWDTVNRTVTLKADTTATTPVTGVDGGEVYGGQMQRRLQVGPTPITLNINRLLN